MPSARSRSKTRYRIRSNPQGILRVMPGGYGFVKTAEGEYFIPSAKMGGAFDGDTVEVVPVSVKKNHKQPARQRNKTENNPTGRVLKVLFRAHEVLIGRYEIAEPFGIVVSEDPHIPYDIFTMRAENPHIKDGDIVKVRIINYPSRTSAATGIIEEVMGHKDEVSLSLELLIARYKLETIFSEAALHEAEKACLDSEACLLDGYRDLRNRIVFTIDPEDARDFDDALSLDEVDGLYRLGVHIADVSRFVPWNSSIDFNARRRATSVYLVDRVIPMLPERLSGDLCSLKPGEIRATMTVDIFLDKACEIKRYEIFSSLIKSSARFTYDEVLRELRCGGNDSALDPSYLSRLTDLHTIALMLAAKRRRMGGIDFLTTEAKVALDDQGKPVNIVLREKTDATEMIEEAMILANTVVAMHLRKHSFPALYRTHDLPTSENLKELVPLIQEYQHLSSVSLADFVAGDPFSIQKILELSQGKPEAELLSSLILRAMKRAVYQPECSPHYGLAKKEYLHFTSPIRRYPDLVVHRMIKALMRGKPETFEQQVNNLTCLAQHASERERAADAAARDSQEIKIVEYLASEVGHVFDAVISGLTSYGFFVRLKNTAEGLVSLRSFGAEYYSLDPKRHVLIGEESGCIFRLGQKVVVVLTNADLRTGHLDFRLFQ